MSDIPIDLMWLACLGGACYFLHCLAELGKPLVDFIVRKIDKKKKKAVVQSDSIESISANLSAEIEKILNQNGKEER